MTKKELQELKKLREEFRNLIDNSVVVENSISTEVNKKNDNNIKELIKKNSSI